MATLSAMISLVMPEADAALDVDVSWATVNSRWRLFPGDAVLPDADRGEDAIIDAIRALRGAILWPARVVDGRILARAKLPGREALRALLAGHPGVSATGVAPAAGGIQTFAISSLSTQLTRRQAEILRLAVDRGFYDLPRRITGVELARELSLSHATVLEHLRKAERAVLAQLGPLVLEKGLDAEWKKAGRPRSRKR